ncbi:extracellular solute-binding protein [Ruania halotolerans]|uniref:extracellular solute-binding protein n=1 Tax=Ruania halotolerans TaxID=2897773 RepID=UPI001E4317A1|nr:extracellular solute-binding protein [Ruania halotolerans]UFU08207.1 extracellular solute-binding protein [Ruania halotolerans]
MQNFPLTRRHLLSAMGVGAGTAALAACTGPVSADGGGEGAASNLRSGFSQAALGEIPSEYQGRTNILFWAPWTGGLFEAMTEQFAMFNEAQTEIYAAIESVGGYADLNTAFTAALQARAVPDMVCFPEMQWLQFYFAGALTPLDSHFDDEWNLDVYLQNFIGESKAGDETYVVPFARSTPLFYYNKSLFNELGLPVDTQYTWSQLREFGAEIASVQSSGQEIKTFAYSGGDAWFANSWLWAFDGVWSDGFQVMPDEAKVSELMTFANEWVHVDGNAYMAQDSHTDFQTGLVAAVHGSTASMRGLTEAVDFELGAAFMPGEVNQPPTVPTGGSGFSLVRTESQERQDATAELLKFLATPAMSGKWHIDSGYVPIVQAAADEPQVQELHATDPNFTVAIQQMENAQTVAPVNWFQSGTAALSEAFASLTGDDADVQATIDTLRGEYEGILEDNREDLEALGIS